MNLINEPELEDEEENADPIVVTNKLEKEKQPTSQKEIIEITRNEKIEKPLEKVIIELEEDPELNFFFKMNTKMVAMYESKIDSIDSASPFKFSRKEIGPLAKSSKLSISVLKKLWFTCDRRSDDSLLRREAVVYLHLIRMIKGGLPLPSKMLYDLNEFIEKGECPEREISMDNETIKIRQEQLIKASKLA